jgi:putative ABC transport system permease protein
MVFFNLKIAWRNIRKNKVFSSVNIIGLALSMACCLVIALYVWNELHYDSFHKNYDTIYRVTEKQDQAGALYNVAVTPGPLAPALQKDFPEVANTVRFGSWSGVLKTGTRTYEVNGIQATDNSIFKVFDFPLLKGNPATALQSPDEIVITESIAEKYFGKEWRNNPALLDQSFRFNNEADFKLAGVVIDPPENSSIRFEALIPISYLFKTDEWSNKWESNNYHTYLQLKPGTDAKAFAGKIRDKLHSYNTKTEDLMVLQPLKEQYLQSKFDFNTDWGKRSNIRYINIFIGVGLLLLIIACVNFINLSTARSLKRSMEVGVRKVNGASRRQLVLQFLSESVLVAFIAGIVSIVIIGTVQPFLQNLTGFTIAVNFSSLLFLSFFLLVILITGFLAGLYPAFILSSFKPAKVFKSANGKGASGKLFRQGLVVCQFAISVTLIICTFFMYRQLRFMQQKDLGFDKEQLVNIRLAGQLKEKAGLLKNDLDNQTAIAATAPATMSLVNVDNSSYVEWEGMQADDRFLITQANVDPGFIPALNLQIMNGNNFSFQKTNDTATYIINEAAVKRMGYTVNNAIGKEVNFWGNKGRIIGVVKDFHFKPLSTGIDPFIFRYQPQDRYFSLFVKTVPGKTQEAIQQIKQSYRKYESEFPLQFSFVDEAINELYREDRRMATIILLFAGLTIFVGCLGLFGLTVFAAERRIKEIGIRKVLGAGVASITGLLSKDFLKLVVIATIIAIPAGWYATQKWLEGYAYRINTDWWVFGLVGLAVLIVALFTISFQSVKAAIANPVKSLRSE